MKHGILTKAVALIVSIIMIGSLPVSALAVSQTDYPIIYISGSTESALYKEPNKTTAQAVCDYKGASFLTPAAQLITGILMATIGESYDSGAAMVIKAVRGFMEPISCDENGNSAYANVGAWYYGNPISYYKEDEIYTETVAAIAEAAKGKVSEDRIFVFTYDWRLDTVANAGLLLEYIDHVKAYTGSSKVSLLAGGFGGIIANSYLYEYMDHATANVNSCIFLNTAILGNSIIGDFMKGEITKTMLDSASLIDAIYNVTGTTRGEAMMQYLKDDPTGTVMNVFTTILGDTTYTKYLGYAAVWLASYIMNDQKLFRTLGLSYNKFAVMTDNTVYDTCLRNYLRNIPGVWALVPEDDYDEAMEFMFEDEIVPSELQSKINSYNRIRSNTEDTLKLAQSNGINVCVVAGYNTQILPVTATVEEQSDGIMSTKYASIGATTTDINDYWAKPDQCINDRHDHMSPDGYVDASTCVLPENTWFIKDLPNMNFSSPTAAAFVVWLLTNDEQRNVWQSADYPQYLQYNMFKEEVTPYSDTSAFSENDFIVGDLDFNGSVTSADARIALRFSVGLESLSKVLQIVGDVDGSGKISAADARLILRFAVGMDKKFPVEA